MWSPSRWRKRWESRAAKSRGRRAGRGRRSGARPMGRGEPRRRQRDAPSRGGSDWRSSHPARSSLRALGRLSDRGLNRAASLLPRKEPGAGEPALAQLIAEAAISEEPRDRIGDRGPGAGADEERGGADDLAEGGGG